MRDKSCVRVKIVYSFIAVLALFFFSGAYAQDQDIPINEEVKTAKKEELPETTRDISGIVVDMLSGEAISGATVSLLNESATTGPDGRFTVKNVKEYHSIFMAVRITTDLDVIIGCSYFSIPTSYYPITANKGNKVDIVIVDMLKGDEVVLKIGEYSMDTVDKYCNSCHEPSPCLIEEEYGKAVSSKVKLKGILVRQSKLNDFIDKMRNQKISTDRYKKIRYEDSHPKSIDITTTLSYSEERVQLPDGLSLKEGKIITCDTCHTRHIPTKWGQYLIMEFIQKESICIKCHK